MKWILVLTGGVVGLLLLAFIVLGFVVKGLDTVYPNVYVSGVKIGGMTYAQAQQALAGVDFSGSRNSIQVQLADNMEFTVTSADAGLEMTADNAASIAYSYGRSKGFAGRVFCYLGCLMKDTDMSKVHLDVDTENLRKIVEAEAAKLSGEAVQNAYRIDETRKVLIVTKGAVARTINTDELVDMIQKAFEEENYAVIQYSTSEEELPEIDFQKVYNEIYVKPVDAKFDKNTFEVIDSVTGVSFNISTAQRLYDQTPEGEELEIPLIYTEPELTGKDLRDMLFRDILSSKTTYLYGSSYNRVNNITLAAEAVNGTILLPGEIFSYNDVVGERTTAKGYLPAGAYAGGKTIEDVGGGICQVSSTIYYCTLYANLETVDRSCHMFVVDYLPIGTDATVNWGTIDFQFRNSSEYPIQINCSVSDDELYVEILGTKTDDLTYEIESEITGVYDYKVVYEDDETLEPGEQKVDTSGHTGYTCNTYRYVYDGDGNLVETQYISSSDYAKQDRVIKVGIEPLPSVSPSASASASPSTGTDPSPEPSPAPETPATEPEGE